MIFMDEIDAIGGSRFSEGTSADRYSSVVHMYLCLEGVCMWQWQHDLFALPASRQVSCSPVPPPERLIRWIDAFRSAGGAGLPLSLSLSLSLPSCACLLFTYTQTILTPPA